MQKHKTQGPANNEFDADKAQDDQAALDVAKAGHGMAEKIKGVLSQPKKKGHWEECCGVRRWVKD